MNKSEKQKTNDAIADLLGVMERLRDPKTGCPWDVEQTYSTIAPYTIEEAYEVAEAIDKGDMENLKEELGDLLFQVIFYAQMGREDGLFDFADIAKGIADKMRYRHPHVFGAGDGEDRSTAQAQTQAWEAQKETDRAAKMKGETASVLDGVPQALPSLTRAEKLQKRAARVGFDWSRAEDVLAKVEEEIAELRAEIREDGSLSRKEDEMGDIIFAVANLARHLELDPETALRRTNNKFERRFRRIEALLGKENRHPDEASLEEMEALWNRAKMEEK